MVETLDDRMWLRSDKGGEAEADFVRRTLRLRSNQRALDAPCGAGRVSLPLACSGIQIVGIDLRKSFIERARRRARREGIQVDLRVADLRFAEIPHSEFHGILNWSTALVTSQSKRI